MSHCTIWQPFNGRNDNKGCCWVFFPSLQASGAAQGIWKMTFYTPEPVSMVLREAEQAGYSAMSTSSRLVVRSPYNTAETYSEDVSNSSPSPVSPPPLLLHVNDIKLSSLGGWSTHGNCQGERVLQGTTWYEYCELGSCLSHR